MAIVLLRIEVKFIILVLIFDTLVYMINLYGKCTCSIRYTSINCYNFKDIFKIF